MTDEAEVPEVIESPEALEETVETTEVEETGEPTTPEAAESDAEDKPKKPKGGVQKRIDELTRQKYEAESRAAALEAQMQESQRQQFKTQYEQSKPTLEQYNYDHESWSRAYEQWATAGIERQQQAISEAQKQQQQYQEQMQKQMRIQQRIAEAQTKYPDFAAKVFDPNVPSLGKINVAAYEAVIESDSMADVAYYLANNPQEVYQLGNMTPIQAVKAIAKIEAKLSKPANTVSKAPPPPSQLHGKSDAVKDPSKMDINQWMEWRNSQAR